MYLGDDKACKVVKKGKVLIKLQNGNQWIKKSDVFEMFKQWKALVQNKIGKKVKCLKSDNGGEYYNKEFENYCAYNGIYREKSTP